VNEIEGKVDGAEKLDLVFRMVRDEIESAMKRHAAMHSPHEGFAVIQEEMSELWTEVMRNNGRNGLGCGEALQVAAMAIRYVVDLVALIPVDQPAPEASPAGERVYGDAAERLRREQMERDVATPFPAPSSAGELPEAARRASEILREEAERDAGDDLDAEIVRDMREAADALESWARERERHHKFEIRTLEAKYDNERVLRLRDQTQLAPTAIFRQEPKPRKRKP
jgi:hypothetical protein